MKSRVPTLWEAFSIHRLCFSKLLTSLLDGFLFSLFLQRGDAEMAQKLWRVVRSCVELGDKNPIVQIHDQGAGGNCNVVKEIIYPLGAKVGAGLFKCPAAFKPYPLAIAAAVSLLVVRRCSLFVEVLGVVRGARNSYMPSGASRCRLTSAP